jgi:hypothetical protein
MAFIFLIEMKSCRHAQGRREGGGAKLPRAPRLSAALVMHVELLKTPLPQFNFEARVMVNCQNYYFAVVYNTELNFGILLIL